MDIRKLQRAIVDGLEDVKAQDIQVFNTEHLSPLFERVIVASGSSNRQTKALAASVRDAVKSRGLPVMRTEGEDNGEWIIVDCGAAVAHIMQPAIRQYYHLEELWGGKAVKMKVGATKVGLVKASEPEPAPAKHVAPKTARAALPATSSRSAARPAATKTAAKSTAKAVAKKAVAAKPGVKKPPFKAGAPKPAAKKATGRSAPVRSRPAQKAAATKTSKTQGGTRRS
ncbi:MAG TPA: ribosome silencing factor [Methylibium sp.]|uniref:ribosome silencing factor n=1 Tax=Methylibium sp. TaxID=2067992 RepID=UPI002DBA4374|nr:ribosome silencing factor [Methylibium sp.]HEU4458426.1 ribosome silencing factor [Methylibium sp.]